MSAAITPSGPVVAVHVSLTNEDRGWRFSDWTERREDDPYGFPDTPGEVFRIARSEYGRCVSKVYVDGPTGPVQTGWYFESRQRYEDDPATYTRGAWVTFERATTLDDVEPWADLARLAVTA